MIQISNNDREEILCLLSQSSELAKGKLADPANKKGRTRLFNLVRRIGIISKKLTSKTPIKNDKD
jgi:hypothetical protein